VGSLKNVVIKKKIMVKLTNEEKAVLIGGILGDEIIVKRDGSYRYRVQHSSGQAEYVHWKRRKLKSKCTRTQPPKNYPTTREGGDSKGRYEVTEFYTDSGMYLKEIHDLLYKKLPNGRYRRTITKETIDHLPVDPLVIAVWYMDDGSIRNDCYAGKISTQGFTYEENELLCDYLRKFNIDCHVVKHTEVSHQWYITIPAHTFGQLISTIEPFVREVPSMIYKLNELRKTP